MLNGCSSRGWGNGKRDCPHADIERSCYSSGMTKTLGQQLAALSVQKRNKKFRTKKAWSDHMKKVRAAGVDKNPIPTSGTSTA
jgi:hypothetical protein